LPLRGSYDRHRYCSGWGEGKGGKGGGGGEGGAAGLEGEGGGTTSREGEEDGGAVSRGGGKEAWESG